MTWVGAPVPRTQDRRMLLGRGKFTGDLDRTGALHAAFVRSPFAAAAVGSIDTSPALALPGVAAAFTAADLGDPALLAVLERPEFVPTPLPLLAIGQVRHVGEPVAVVLAEDPYTAEDAIELVDVDWSPQPVVASLDAAAAPGAPQVHRQAPGNCLVDLTMFDDERLDG
ncbi:MAG: xanthine dehydrogenase family protein molybdopterin-binding subunit, partial [Streptosporangiaceae bacterium]